MLKGRAPQPPWAPLCAHPRVTGPWSFTQLITRGDWGLSAVIKRALISLALACWWHAVSSRSTLTTEDKPSWTSGCERGSVGSSCASALSSHTYLLSLTICLTKQCQHALFSNRLFDPVLSVSLWCLFSSDQVAEGVCVWICVCLSILHNLRTYLRKKEKEADTDWEPEPGCCNRVSSAWRGERYLRWILTLWSWMGLWEQNLDSSWGRKHIPILLELFLWLGRQIVAPPPSPPHTPFMCLDEGEGCNEWQGCESSLYSAQQTFFLLKLCAICSHHALTHILKHPTLPVLFILGSDRGWLMNTESDHVQPERQRKG